MSFNTLTHSHADPTSLHRMEKVALLYFMHDKFLSIAGMLRVLTLCIFVRAEWMTILLSIILIAAFVARE